MLSRQNCASYGPWQLLPPVKQLTPLFVQVPHQGDVSVTPNSASNCLRKAPVIPVREMRRKQPSGLRYNAFCTLQTDATAIGPTREDRQPRRELK